MATLEKLWKKVTSAGEGDFAAKQLGSEVAKFLGAKHSRSALPCRHETIANTRLVTITLGYITKRKHGVAQAPPDSMNSSRM